MNNPILSICIPTYNRATYLEDTINSIVTQKRFQETNDVEIVISDNCSGDNTREVAQKFTAVFDDKIRYYKNAENIKDANYEKVLSYGIGIFLKLNNDTLPHQEGSLDYLIAQINYNSTKKPILFFTNGFIAEIQYYKYCTNLDSFVSQVSYFVTWIGAFGIWKEDFSNLKNFNRYSHLSLVQVDVMFRLIKLKNSVVIDNKILFNGVTPARKNGYDFLTVFLDNYFFILNEQYLEGELRKKTFDIEKKRVLLKYICYYLVKIKVLNHQYQFDVGNANSKILHHYKKYPLLLSFFYLKYIMYYLYFIIKMKDVFHKKTIHFLI